MGINYGAHLNQDDSTSEQMPPTISEKGQAALDYAALGIPVHPLHSVNNGMCSCPIIACYDKRLKSAIQSAALSAYHNATSDVIVQLAMNLDIEEVAA